MGIIKGSVCYKRGEQHIQTMWMQISFLSTIQCICKCVCVCVLSLSDDGVGVSLRCRVCVDSCTGKAGFLVPVTFHNKHTQIHSSALQ